MGEFSADWLTLREPADAAARSSRLTGSIARALGSSDEILGILDLAAGTGANARYLADHLPVEQRWLLVDNDSRLLARVPEQMSSWGAARGYEVTRDADELLVRGPRLMCRLATRRLDLNLRASDDGLHAGRRLVTASAFLDLVSERWLQTLAARCFQSRAGVLFALTYDGRILCSPEEPEDEAVRALVNRHQRIDKGFGVAVGPDAADKARACLTSVGYDVQWEPSDWVLPPEAGELQRQLIDGWAQAAAAIAPEHSLMIRSWRIRRLAHIEGHRSLVVVGHSDLAAWLPA